MRTKIPKNLRRVVIDDKSNRDGQGPYGRRQPTEHRMRHVNRGARPLRT